MPPRSFHIPQCAPRLEAPPEPALPVGPNDLCLMIEYEKQGGYPSRTSRLSLAAAQIICDTMVYGLFEVPNNTRQIESQSWNMHIRQQLGKAGITEVPVLKCTYAGLISERPPRPSLMIFPAESLANARPSNPNITAQQCADKYLELFRDTYVTGEQTFTSGYHFMTHRQLINHIVKQLRYVRSTPSTSEKWANQIACTAQPVSWAVTGASERFPRLNFDTYTRRTLPARRDNRETRI